MKNTFLHFLAERGHLQITCEGPTGNDRAADRSYGSGAIVHRDMETMKNSGKGGGGGGKVIVKRSQTARPAYQLYLLQWETAAGSAFGAFPELNSTVAGSFRAARLQARVVTNE